MTKDIMLERVSEWSDLRYQVYKQKSDTTKVYSVGPRVFLAAQAVRNVARKYGFSVAVKPDEARQQIIVWRGETRKEQS